MIDDSDWKKRFGAAQRAGAKESCPRAELLAAWSEGPLPPEAVGHLAACAPCREDLLVLRRRDTRKTERASAELRTRLCALQARPARRMLWFAAAAAILLAIAGALLMRSSSEPAPVASRPPAPKEIPAPPQTRIDAPRPTPEAPAPVRAPERPAPVPVPGPEKKPAPLPPTPEPPVVATPAPAPEKPIPPAPAPDKPAPEPTRAALKGTLVAIAGPCSAQPEGDAAPPTLKPGQKREFSGTIRLKAETAPAKVAAGTVTYYVQRGTELAILLQEGRTRVQLAKGEAFFDVTPGFGAFEVESGQAKVSVKGTRFLVSAERPDTEVVVQRGAVEVAAAGASVSLSSGERSTASAGKTPMHAQKVDLARRLAWVRGLDEFLWIEAEQMALQGGMTILPDAAASGGRAIGFKDPPKPGTEASAELRVKRKQSVPYAVWVRFLWPHNVPSSLSLSVGDALRWTSKDVAPAPGWQWVRAGAAELPEDPFRIRLADTRVGMKIDQLLLTSDLEFNPETDKR